MQTKFNSAPVSIILIRYLPCSFQSDGFTIKPESVLVRFLFWVLPTVNISPHHGQLHC